MVGLHPVNRAGVHEVRRASPQKVVVLMGRLYGILGVVALVVIVLLVLAYSMFMRLGFV